MSNYHNEYIAFNVLYEHAMRVKCTGVVLLWLPDRALTQMFTSVNTKQNMHIISTNVKHINIIQKLVPSDR